MTPWDEEKSLYRMELWLDVKEAFRTGWSRGLRDKSRALHILIQILLGFVQAMSGYSAGRGFVGFDVEGADKLSAKKLRRTRAYHVAFAAIQFSFSVAAIAYTSKWWLILGYIVCFLWDSVRNAMKALSAHKHIPMAIIRDVHDA